ncbi:MAG: hypothetical protein QXP29_07380, partial [Candidatus Nezhaarchaeales archaeon]
DIVLDYYNKIKGKKLRLGIDTVQVELMRGQKGTLVEITFLETGKKIYMAPAEFLRRNYINRLQIVDEHKGDGE